MADFNPIILERLLQNMADDDYSTKTIRDVYNILNAMFKYAVHNRILTFNPCAGVEVPKTKTKQIRVLTVKEQREVLEHAKERIHENLIQVALGTGMRGGELLGLTWDDVDFRKREISVNKTLVYIKDKETKKYVFKYQTPKTKNSIRTIPMQDSVYKALKRQWIQLKEMQLSASEWQPLEGFENLIDSLQRKLKDTPIFISFDIDFLDAAYAPGTGTPEICGFNTFEAQRLMLEGLRGLNIVGADLVEVLPAYDSPGQITAYAACGIIFDMISLIAFSKS